MSISEELSRDARRFVSLDSSEIRRRAGHTREFLSKFRLGNPLRWVLAKKTKSSLIADATGEWLSESDLADMRDLGFFPSGRYKEGTVEYERWIGPEGFMSLEFGRQTRFLSVYFENNTKVVTGPGDATWKAAAETQPKHVFLDSSESLRADYLRMLEETAAYAKRVETTPLYRARSRDLDEAVAAYYEEHIVSLSMVKTRLMMLGVEALTGVALGAAMPEVTQELGYQMFETVFKNQAHTDDNSVRFDCESCGHTNRFPANRLGGQGTCGHCHERIVPSFYLLQVESVDGLASILENIPIPAVVVFWTPRQTRSITVLGTYFDSGLMSDGQFLVFSVDVTKLHALRSQHGVTELPTAIRFESGAETGRHEGMIAAKDAPAFGLGQ